jgi:signal transduction histidine kinase
VDGRDHLPHPLQILVVDDEDNIRKTLACCLENEGHRVAAVGNPADAVAEIAQLVRADANKITWVLTNLVSNALRYVPEQGRISLKGERLGSQVQVAVQDDGPGIPPEDRARIFQKCGRLPGRAGGGTGLERITLRRRLGPIDLGKTGKKER